MTYYWRDLTAANKKNDTATKIDSEIIFRPYLTNDGNKFYYTKGDDQRLYVYDRKTGEKSKLDDSVQLFFINKAGNYLIYVVLEDEKYYLYEMTMKGLTGEKNKIDSDVEPGGFY